MTAEKDKAGDVTRAPVTDEKTGVAMAGKYPLNHRLRAEALATAGKASDPDSLIDDSLIEDAKARLAKLAKAAAKATDNTPAPAETSKEA